MAGKARVHELAREFGVPANEVLAALSRQGESVKSASSTVDAPVVRRLRAVFERDASSPEGRKIEAVAAQPREPQAPPYSFVRERTTAAVHHRNYLNGRSDQSLCGCEEVDAVEEPDRTEADCPVCQSQLPEYHAKWWRAQFNKANSELKALRKKCEKAEERCENQRKQLSAMQRKAQTAKKLKYASRGVAAARHSAATTGPKRSVSNRTLDVPPAKSKRRKQSRRDGVVDLLKPHHVSTARIGRGVGDPKSRAVDPKVVRKRVKEMMAPPRTKSAAERRADEAAADTMRSQKPSSWRLGKSPSSYG